MSARRILKADLRRKPYKMQISQVSNTDNERRLRFCQQINGLSEKGRLNTNTIIFGDECRIYLNVTLFAKSFNVYIQVVFIGKFSFHFGWRFILVVLLNNENTLLTSKLTYLESP